MTVLIVGASGYIGTRVFKNLQENHDVVGTYHNNNTFDELQRLNITEKDSVLEIIDSYQPDTIVHAAAIASRSRCRNSPKEAVATNARGTKHIVEAANRQESSVIYISTLGADELDSFYGEIKLIGEDYVRDADAGYDILRASMTYGYCPNIQNDRPFNRIIKSLQNEGQTQYDDSWLFQPTYLKQLSLSIQALLNEGTNNQTNHLVVPEFKTKFEIASDILEPFNKDIEPKMNYSSRTRTGGFRTTDSKFPTYSYSEMIQGIIDNIRKHGLSRQ